MVKRRLAAGLSAALLAGMILPVSAAKVTGYALYTDITAQINGHPLRSYNVNGRTAVAAEDLRQYGFYALWDSEDRTLRVTRALNAQGEPETPYQWPDYTAPVLTHSVGSRAQDILATDIKTYVAGAEAESFNIDGETLIWFSDLAPFGTVTYDDGERVAALTLGDPVELAMTGIEDDLKKSGLSYTFERYDGRNGSLAVYTQSGTPHGSVTNMLYIGRNGERLNIQDLLPSYPASYLQPRSIQLDNSGDTLTFITPVKEILDYAAGTEKDWGDTLCRVNLSTGNMLSMQPLSQPLTEWSVYASSPDREDELGPCLELTVVRNGDGPALEIQEWPGRQMQISLSQEGFSVTHTAFTLLSDEHFQESAYGKAYDILRKSLPDASQDVVSPVNTQEQRELISRYFQVTLNGQTVSGTLWCSKGNNHEDLNFDFDQPVSLSDGDVIRVWMGTA